MPNIQAIEKHLSALREKDCTVKELVDESTKWIDFLNTIGATTVASKEQLLLDKELAAMVKVMGKTVEQLIAEGI